jgi:hypothetical protein
VLYWTPRRNEIDSHRFLVKLPSSQHSAGSVRLVLNGFTHTEVETR